MDGIEEKGRRWGGKPTTWNSPNLMDFEVKGYECLSVLWIKGGEIWHDPQTQHD